MDSLVEWDFIGKIIASTAALGTASFGLVDASKAFRGGVSNIGYKFIRDALAPFEPALRLIDDEKPYGLLEANWLNGVDKAEQKTTAKNLIRLGLTSKTAPQLGAAIPGIDAPTLARIAEKVDRGETPTDEEITLLGRFDAMVDARLEAAFERADQKYRNTARVAAAVVAIILAQIGAAIVFDPYDGGAFVVALMVGALATPIAPVAKDVTSALSTAVAAFKAIKR